MRCWHMKPYGWYCKKQNENDMHLQCIMSVDGMLGALHHKVFKRVLVWWEKEGLSCRGMRNEEKKT